MGVSKVSVLYIYIDNNFFYIFIFFNVLKILNGYHLVSSEFTHQNSFRESLAQFFETRHFEKVDVSKSAV